jgi:polyhydroxybutyrate depolymerase
MMHARTLRLIVTVAIAATSPALLVQAQRGDAASGARRVALTFQDRARQYLLYIPAAPNGSLVLAFHGGGSSAAQLQRVTGLDALADREHFILAYPEAFERSWAAGVGGTFAEKQGVDDVGFAKAVIDDIARTHTLDRARVFATGLSNGAVLTHRLGCEASDTFAAIAPVIGAIAKSIRVSCRPSVPVAVVAIQGLDDPSVPFEGDAVVEGSRTTEALWRSLNGCTPTVTTTPLPVLVNDGTSVQRRTSASCRDGGDVVWYEIQGGGHRWPPETVSDARSQAENGVSSQNVDASEVIWAFFATHRRR